VRLGVTNRLAFVLVVIGALLASACDIAPFDVFTDPSTRLAGALRDAALLMDLQRQDTYTLAYHFKPGHDGCKSGDFRLEMAANAGLLVVCTTPMGPGDMGGLTTSHLTYVAVPKRLEITKSAGEILYIDLARREGLIEVVGLR
jgi:hypothetical protein